MTEFDQRDYYRCPGTHDKGICPYCGLNCDDTEPPLSPSPDQGGEVQ